MPSAALKTSPWKLNEVLTIDFEAEKFSSAVLSTPACFHGCCCASDLQQLLVA